MPKPTAQQAFDRLGREMEPFALQTHHATKNQPSTWMCKYIRPPDNRTFHRTAILGRQRKEVRQYQRDPIGKPLSRPKPHHGYGDGYDACVRILVVIPQPMPNSSHHGGFSTYDTLVLSKVNKARFPAHSNLKSLFAQLDTIP